MRATLKQNEDLTLFTSWYCDDLVIFADTYQQCLQRMRKVQAALQRAGWRINHRKTEMPTQCLSILGVRFDLRAQCTRLSKSFQASLLQQIDVALQADTMSRKKVASIAGSINWGAVGSPMLSSCADPFIGLMMGAQGWNRQIEVTPDAKRSLRQAAHLVQRNPWSTYRAVHPRAGRYFTDASSHMLAVVSQDGVYAREFQEQERALHIGPKEALALSTACAYVMSKSVDAVFLSDSKSLVQAVHKGRSHNPHYNAVASSFARARQLGLSWKLQWISTHVNPADLPTRPEKLPAGVVHPEQIQPGKDAWVPLGWNTPNYAKFLRAGAIKLREHGEIEELKLVRVTWN
jgi:hypothetical protein